MNVSYIHNVIYNSLVDINRPVFINGFNGSRALIRVFAVLKILLVS